MKLRLSIAAIIVFSLCSAFVRATDRAVYAAALDAKGKAIPFPDAAHLTVKDEGQNAPIQAITSVGQKPVRCMFLVDNSGSMKSHQQELADTLALAVKAVIRPNVDGAKLVDYSDNAYFDIEKYSTDPEEFRKTVNQHGPAGGTAMLDAVESSAQYLMKDADAEGARRILFVIGDGDSNEDSHDVRHAVTVLIAAGVQVFAISIRPKDKNSLAPQLFELVKETGGQAINYYSPSFADDLKNIRDILDQQVALTFAPARNTPGKSHKLEIRASDSKVRILHRLRYVEPQ